MDLWLNRLIIVKYLNNLYILTFNLLFICFINKNITDMLNLFINFIYYQKSNNIFNL